MKRILLLLTGVVGLVEITVPRSFVRAWMRVAFRNAEAAEPREWVYGAVRAEGVVFVLVALVGLFRAGAADGVGVSTRLDQDATDD
ncbi:hypothetical protein GJ633_10875 [Halorubrum sp. CBA1125]|jgi:hypothetical protein|uniref:hypothetical protein n=1 Tax=Halorubrum sp. CBA1125 TaxID=2668072 RepID=UPI0012E84905|nr:hypothetical protein [Halorubrum sp. CBA1125]MUW15105.1 hypothetical protein [Halorubrum sp. CBA1125]